MLSKFIEKFIWFKLRLPIHLNLHKQNIQKHSFTPSIKTVYHMVSVVNTRRKEVTIMLRKDEKEGKKASYFIIRK